MWSLAYVAYDLYDCLFNQRLTPCVDDHLCGLSIGWKYLPLRYLSEIVHLSRHVVVIRDRHSSDEELSCWLDATDLLPCVVVSLVISISRTNWLDDEQSPSEMSSN